MSRVEEAPDEIVSAAKEGPHAGWDTFDLRLEGARFHLLQGIVASAPFDADAAQDVLADLEAFARSYGYGTTDTYLTDAAGKSDDEIGSDPQLALMRENIFDNPEEDQYFHEVRISGRALLAGAATAEARDFLTPRKDSPFGPGGDGSYGAVYSCMMRAFEAGRDERKNLDMSAFATP